MLGKRNCVVVVAEGAGEAVLDGQFSNSGEKDASGNIKFSVIKYFEEQLYLCLLFKLTGYRFFLIKRNNWLWKEERNGSDSQIYQSYLYD